MLAVNIILHENVSYISYKLNLQWHEIEYMSNIVYINSSTNSKRVFDCTAKKCLSPVQAENYSLFVAFLVILLGFFVFNIINFF